MVQTSAHQKDRERNGKVGTGWRPSVAEAAKASRLARKKFKWVPTPCPVCGALTSEDAAKLCRPQSLPSGDYHCPSDDEAVSCSEDTLRFPEDGTRMEPSPESRRDFDVAEGAFYAAWAVKEGYTTWDQMEEIEEEFTQ